MTICPNCGASLEHEDDLFCGVCGAAIAQPATPPVPPAVPRQRIAAPPVAPRYGKGLKLLLYAASFLLPPVGILLGIIFLIRPDRGAKGLGRACLIIGLAVSLVLVVLACALLGLLGMGGTVVLHNNTGQTICFVYISPADSDTWGSDRLGTTEVISPGWFRVFVVPAGFYDLRADDCSHNELEVQWNVEIRGLTYWNAQ